MRDSINKCCVAVGDAGNSHISVESPGEAAIIAVAKGRMIMELQPQWF